MSFARAGNASFLVCRQGRTLCRLLLFPKRTLRWKRKLFRLPQGSEALPPPSLTQKALSSRPRARRLSARLSAGRRKNTRGVKRQFVSQPLNSRPCARRLSARLSAKRRISMGFERQFVSQVVNAATRATVVCKVVRKATKIENRRSLSVALNDGLFPKP